MINQSTLEKDTSKFLNKEVLAVGIFDVSVTNGKRNVAPAAAGLAAGLITKQVQKKVIKKKKENTDSNSYSMGNRVLTGAVGVATFVGTQQLMKHSDAKNNNLTPKMICAVTKNRIYLLDWKGTHHNGKGPTKILAEFNLRHSKIKTRTRNMVHHTVEIKEDGNYAKIECNLGATHSNKKMNREVLEILKEQD